jgi:hypothetical protein
MTEFQIPSPSSRQFHPPLKTSSLPEKRREFSHLSTHRTDERDSTISPTFTNSGYGSNLVAEVDRQTKLPDRWQAEIRDRGNGRRPNSSSILTEVPRALINSSVRSKEWVADKVCAESECSRVDFMMMSDGPQCMNDIISF